MSLDVSVRYCVSTFLLRSLAEEILFFSTGKPTISAMIYLVDLLLRSGKIIINMILILFVNLACNTICKCVGTTG